MRGFLNDLYLRISCYRCHYRSLVDCSDITLGDFWGVENILPSMYDDKGTSLLMIHSERGMHFLLQNKLVERIKVDIEDIIKFSTQRLYSEKNIPQRRKTIFNRLQYTPFMKLSVIIEKDNILKIAKRKILKIWKGLKS